MSKPDALNEARKFVHDSLTFHENKKRGPEKDLTHGWEYHQGAADVLRQVEIILGTTRLRQALLKDGSEPG